MWLLLFLDIGWGNKKLKINMISEKAFTDSAVKIGCDVAAIKAVAEVESSGDGFMKNGSVKILFEPHVFWQQLKRIGINPKDHLTGNEDILYQIWGAKPYGKYSEQHSRLERAKLISEEAALKSASWGKFQIMGYNHLASGYQSVFDFVVAMKRDEDSHLAAFVSFVLSKNLDDELINLEWAAFAFGYNGSGYKKNKYDEKLAAAYNKYK